MFYKKSLFLVIISWIFILLSPIVVCMSFMISISSSTLTLNMDSFIKALKQTNLDERFFDMFIRMIEYTSIVSIITLALSVVGFFAGISLLKRRSWARSYICSLVFIKTIIVSLFILVLLFLAMSTSQAAELGLLLTGLNIVLFFSYKKLSSKSIKELCIH